MYRFSIDPGWPTNGPAQIVKLLIENDGLAFPELELSAGELRALVREAVRGLGFTQISRPSKVWLTTWTADVEKLVNPILVLIGALLPKPKVKLKRSA